MFRGCHELSKRLWNDLKCLGDALMLMWVRLDNAERCCECTCDKIHILL